MQRSGAQLRQRIWLFQLLYVRLVYWRWSPEQIAARLKVVYPDDVERHISHEMIDVTIFAHPLGALKQALVAPLR